MCVHTLSTCPSSIHASAHCHTVHGCCAGLGIAIVNDFKSIEGDRKMGLMSLPVAFGVDTGETA
jgi:4-hydroxybenzoate polyprenyltransferase